METATAAHLEIASTQTEEWNCFQTVYAKQFLLHKLHAPKFGRADIRMVRNQLLRIQFTFSPLFQLKTIHCAIINCNGAFALRINGSFLWNIQRNFLYIWKYVFCVNNSAYLTRHDWPKTEDKRVGMGRLKRCFPHLSASGHVITSKTEAEKPVGRCWLFPNLWMKTSNLTEA